MIRLLRDLRLGLTCALLMVAGVSVLPVASSLASVEQGTHRVAQEAKPRAERQTVAVSQAANHTALVHEPVTRAQSTDRYRFLLVTRALLI